MRISIIITVSLILLLFGSSIASVRAAETIGFVVLRENGVGSNAQAQPYLDRLLNFLAQKTAWQDVKGKYLTRRESALAYIREEHPHFGILSLSAFLALQENHRLVVIGQVDVPLSGDRQYFIVSKQAGKLESCRKKKLASNHLQDTKFIESVVAEGSFRMVDFQILPTRRPVQTIKTVIRDQATCALIDNAQWETARKVDGGGDLRVVWKSKVLPPMPVVAFAGATDQQIKELKKALPTLCHGEGLSTCKGAGILSLKRASDATYRHVLRAYSN